MTIPAENLIYPRIRANHAGACNAVYASQPNLIYWDSFCYWNRELIDSFGCEKVKC